MDSIPQNFIRGLQDFVNDTIIGNEENEEPANAMCDSDGRMTKRKRVGGTPIKQQQRSSEQKRNQHRSFSENFDLHKHHRTILSPKLKSSATSDISRQPGEEVTAALFEERNQMSSRLSFEERNQMSSRLSFEERNQIPSRLSFGYNSHSDRSLRTTKDKTNESFQEITPKKMIKTKKPTSSSKDRRDSMLSAASTPQLPSTTSELPPLSNTKRSNPVSRLAGGKRDIEATTCPGSTTKLKLPAGAISSRVGMTPVRVKPRFKKEDIQATNNGYASVAKLSAWLADDPTSTTKVRQLRRGANVINKSRRFEKNLEFVIIEEGSTQEKKNALQAASIGDDESGTHYDEGDFRTHNRKNWGDGAQSEIIMKNDTSSRISVTNKKKWLENAFKRTDGEIVLKAKTDIMSQDDSRDDIASRAKRMWLEKSNARKARQKEEKRIAEPPDINKTITATPDKGKTSMATPDKATYKAKEYVVEEDRTKIDMRKARRILIERSKRNGNEVRLNNKFGRRLETFEKMGQETVEKMLQQERERGHRRRCSEPSSYSKQSWGQKAKRNPSFIIVAPSPESREELHVLPSTSTKDEDVIVPPNSKSASAKVEEGELYCI